MFEKNLQIFQRFSPHQAPLVREAYSLKYELCTSDDESPNIRMGEASGYFYFHSQKEGTIEAELWFNSLEDIEKIDTLVVFGVGRGLYYHAAKKWLKAKPQRFLIFIEHDIYLLHLFFQTKEADVILSDPQVIISGMDPHFDTHERIQFSDLKLISNILINGSSLMTELKSYQMRYVAIWAMIKKALNYYLKELDWKRLFFTPFTLDDIQKNAARNLFMLPESRLLYPMKNAFKGIPALICGAGPSLEEDIEKIKDIKDKALIFGAGTGMNVLNKHQIFPHFGVGIDPDEASISRILTNYAYETPYFFSLKFNHQALEILHGEKIYFKEFNVYGINYWFEEKLGLDKWELIAYSASTTYAALSLAKFLGCNPIIFLGIDLAYTDERRYPKSIEAHPLDPSYTQVQINSPSIKEKLKTIDNQGTELFTRADWIFEATGYQSFAKINTSMELINATAKGLAIPGFKALSFQKVIEEYLSESFEIEKILKEAIEKAPFIDSSLSQIKDTISEWIMCLVEGEILIERMQKDLTHSGKLSDDLWIEFTKLPVYRYFLGVVEGHYETVSFQDNFLINYRPEVLTEEEIFLKKKTYEQERLSLLLSYLRIVEKIYISAFAIDLETENSKIKSEIPYQNGVLDGVVKLYYSNGQLKREISFVKGLLHGKERYWDKKGLLLLETEYFFGQPTGISKSYHPSGQIKMEKTYHGSPDRFDLKRWNPSGELIENKTYLPKDFEGLLEQKSQDTRERLEKIRKSLEN